MTAKKIKIFISHSAHKAADEEFLKELVERLKKADFQVYWDCERLKPGDVWPNELFSAIGCCHAAVVLVTEEALNVARRPWVFQECSMLTILKWADKEFPVVPVLMTGVTPEMVRQSPFQELRFHELQAGSCRDIDLVEKTIIERLGACAGGDEEEPLYHHHQRIATRLEMVEEAKLLQSVIDAVDWHFERWERLDGKSAYRLARVLLTLKSERAVDALRDLLPHLGESQAMVLLGLLAPFWYDLRATARLDDVVQNDQRWVRKAEAAAGRRSRRARTSFWLNGVEPLTAKLYASRAGYMKKYPYTVITPPPDAGMDEVGRYAEHIITEMNTKGSLVQNPKMREALALKQAVERPTFVIIPPKTSKEVIAALRERFWPFIFIVLSGADETQGRGLSKFQMLRPTLKEGAEFDICYRFTEACKTAERIITGV